MYSIGNRIKNRRKELKMNADELAQRIGKDRSTIYRYEKGDIENLPIDLLEPLAKALETTPQHLMGWDHEQIDALSEIEKDKNEYIDAMEQEMKLLMEEFGELQLTKEEMQEVFDYAKYIKSKRK